MDRDKVTEHYLFGQGNGHGKCDMWLHLNGPIGAFYCLSASLISTCVG